MKTLRRSVSLLALLLVAASLPAVAEIFRVALTNGTVLETRYKPEAASWDPNQVLLLTDVGNWIGVPKDEVKEVTSDTETRGFGLLINTTTIAIGLSANDAITPEQEAQQAQQAAQQGGSSALEQFLSRSYDVQQFVDTNQTGQGGIPVYGVTSGPTTSEPEQ
jgi:hypothetical protein